MKITNAIELQEALEQKAPLLELENSISMPNPITLAPGQKLIGMQENVFLSFINSEGIALT